MCSARHGGSARGMTRSNSCCDRWLVAQKTHFGDQCNRCSMLLLQAMPSTAIAMPDTPLHFEWTHYKNSGDSAYVNVAFYRTLSSGTFRISVYILISRSYWTYIIDPNGRHLYESYGDGYTQKSRCKATPA